MKYKIKQSGKTQKIINFHISKELISGELEKIYREVSKTASLEGFRKGKAPVELIKKRYKKEAREEVIRNLLTDSFRKAISESDIDMLGMPEISDMDFDEEKGMLYKATVNIKPQVKLKGYKGLSLKKGEGEVKESDVDREMDRLKEINAKFQTKEGIAKTGDYIICNIDCIVEDRPVEKKENAWLYVGEESFIPGKELEGLKVGDKKDIDKDLPKDYSKKEIAGKKAKFRISVLEIKEKNLPELNDEFAHTAGNFKTVAELREAVRENIKSRNKMQERQDLENQALKLLDKIASFDVPQFMVDRHMETLVNNAKERLKLQKLSEDQIKSMESDLKVRLKGEAVREVRAFFILDEIANSENITVDEKEIDVTFDVMASSSGRMVGEIRKYYNENKLIENLREDIRQKKVIDFLIKNANISG